MRSQWMCIGSSLQYTVIALRLLFFSISARQMKNLQVWAHYWKLIFGWYFPECLPSESADGRLWWEGWTIVVLHGLSSINEQTTLCRTWLWVVFLAEYLRQILQTRSHTGRGIWSHQQMRTRGKANTSINQSITSHYMHQRILSFEYVSISLFL